MPNQQRHSPTVESSENDNNLERLVVPSGAIDPAAQNAAHEVAESHHEGGSSTVDDKSGEIGSAAAASQALRKFIGLE